jgi:hypothetical protein
VAGAVEVERRPTQLWVTTTTFRLPRPDFPAWDHAHAARFRSPSGRVMTGDLERLSCGAETAARWRDPLARNLLGGDAADGGGSGLRARRG